jgi:hypothetical protein
MVLTLLSFSPALANDDSAANFFALDKEYWSKGLKAPEGGAFSSAPVARTEVAKAVARIAQEQLGTQWVASAMKLAKIESSYTCRATGPKTSHGRAKGVLQVMPGSARALGYDPNRLHECEYGIRAGIAHMRRCLEAGVSSEREMAACHVAGWRGWNIKLAKRHERYKQHYIRLALV